MVQHRAKNSLPITALPMLSYAIEGALDAAKDQLDNLQKAKDRPHVLDDQLVEQIINSCTKQNESIADEKSVCMQWEKTKLSAMQKKSINKLWDNLIELEKVHQQILFLAEHYKDHTIDKIMGMDDMEAALAYLTGKLHLPTARQDTHKPKASNKESSFKLPPDVSCKKKGLPGGGESYIFNHSEWGELGHIEVIPHGRESQISAYAVLSDPEDPLAELRASLFHTITMGFNSELEKIPGKSSPTAPPVSSLRGNQKIIESKLMVCEICDAPVALLIFAPDAYTPGGLEDYARMMHANIKKTNPKPGGCWEDVRAKGFPFTISVDCSLEQ